MWIGLVCRNSKNKRLLWKRRIKKNNWLLLPNFKKIQQNLTVHHALFLHQLCVPSVWPEKNKIPVCPHKHRYTNQTCSRSSGFSCACSCNYLLIACQLLRTYLFPLPIFLDLWETVFNACLMLESGQRFGARVTSYRSMWTVYRIY